MSDGREKWIELADAAAVGQELSRDELALLDEHRQDPSVADEHAVFAAIAGLGECEPLRDDDRLRAEATLRRFEASEAASRRKTTWVGLALACAAIFVSWLVASSSAIDLQSEPVAEARVSSGELTLAGHGLAPGDTIPAATWVRARTHACVDIDGADVCLGPGSELRIAKGAVELRAGALEVVTGKVTMHDGDAPRVLVAGESFEIPAPAMGEPAPEPAATEPARAIEPAARAIEPAARDTAQARAPTRRPQPPAPRPAGRMLADARTLANAGELRRAVAAYEGLRRAHPRSAEAHAANVSLGQLQLRRGRLRVALAAFDRYLARGGALAEEAHWGRVQALHRLGRTRSRDRAIERLLGAHPHSVYADKAEAMRSP